MCKKLLFWMFCALTAAGLVSILVSVFSMAIITLPINSAPTLLIFGIFATSFGIAAVCFLGFAEESGMWY